MPRGRGWHLHQRYRFSIALLTVTPLSYTSITMNPYDNNIRNKSRSLMHWYVCKQHHITDIIYYPCNETVDLVI